MVDVRSKIFLRRTVTIIVIGGFFVLFHSFSFFQPVENIFLNIAKPFQRTLYSISLFFRKNSSCPITVDENTVNNLLVENARLRMKLQDLQSFQNLAQFSEKEKIDIVSCRVLSMNSSTSMKILILDKGSKQGIQKGNAAVSSQGILIGKVIEVSDELSKVMLIVDRSSSISVRVQNDVSSPGIIVGEKSLSLRLKFVPQNENIQIGQVIVTAGLEGGIPRGLIVGKIDSVISETGDLFQEAFVESFVRYDRLDVVGIIKY